MLSNKETDGICGRHTHIYQQLQPHGFIHLLDMS